MEVGEWGSEITEQIDKICLAGLLKIVSKDGDLIFPGLLRLVEGGIGLNEELIKLHFVSSSSGVAGNADTQVGLKCGFQVADKITFGVVAAQPFANFLGFD